MPSPVPIPFAGAQLGTYRHVCAFFRSPEEEYQTLLPFIRDGLAQGERAYHVLQSRHQDDHLARLRRGGIDVETVQRTSQLELATPRDTYLRPGRFDKDAMLNLMQEALAMGKMLGFPLTRFIAHGETVLADGAAGQVNDWIEYESRLNDVLPQFHDPVICSYDSNLLNGSIAFDILRTHPVAVIGGVLYENPFFAVPADLLREVRSRDGNPPRAYRG